MAVSPLLELREIVTTKSQGPTKPLSSTLYLYSLRLHRSNQKECVVDDVKERKASENCVVKSWNRTRHGHTGAKPAHNMPQSHFSAPFTVPHDTGLYTDIFSIVYAAWRPWRATWSISLVSAFRKPLPRDSRRLPSLFALDGGGVSSQAHVLGMVLSETTRVNVFCMFFANTGR